MFLSKDEKVLLYLYRIEQIRAYTLLGFYNSYSVGEKKIKKLQNKIIKLGGNSNAIINVIEKSATTQP